MASDRRAPAHERHYGGMVQDEGAPSDLCRRQGSPSGEPRGICVQHSAVSAHPDGKLRYSRLTIMASNPWSGSSVDARLGPPQLRLDRRVTLVLGGGAVRGMTHLGVLEVLAASGLQVREMIGTSIGALVVAFYAAVGMDVQSLIAAGLALKSRHLLCCAMLPQVSCGDGRGSPASSRS